jgi:kinesin family protein 11
MINIEDNISHYKCKIKLCDLAGSERYNSPDVYKKEHINEMKNINKSLFTLGNVINALAQKKKYVPYKDSKLTRILEDSLKGNSSIYLIATISPNEKNIDETYHTLKFADRAHSIMVKITPNQVGINKGNDNNKKFEELYGYKKNKEIEKLKGELMGFKKLMILKENKNNLQEQFLNLKKENNKLKSTLKKINNIDIYNNMIRENKKLKKELNDLKIDYFNLKNELLLNKKIINNNIIETNNTTGTLGTLLMNKEDTNISKGLGLDINKSIKKKSFKNVQSNPIINITDSIESKSKENTSHYININNNNIIKITNKKAKNNPNTKNELKVLNDMLITNNKERLEIIPNNSNSINKDNKENNEPISNNTDNYYKLLDISPDPPSSYEKTQGMSKKNKSVSNIYIPKKEEKDEVLKKSPLSKKSLMRPRLSDKIIIKFEDLLEFETKLDNIITALSNNDNINEGGASNECTEFMSFYFHSSLCGIFTNFFNPKNKIIIHSGNNLLLLSIIITYHLSINPKMLFNLVDDMKYVFSLLKINYLLLIKKIEIYYDEDFPIKYVDILNQKLGQVKTTNCSNEIDIISKINKNCCNISERIKLILNHYQRNNDKSYNEFNGIFKNISTVSEKNINNYFYNYLYINPFDFENNKINNINNINDNYNKNLASKNFSHMDSSISSISNTSIKGYDDNDSDNFYNDNMSYKTEKSSDNERELLSVKSYKSSNYYGKIKTNNIGSTINCDNNFYYNIENNIYENDEDGTNAYEIMQMLKDYEINKVASPFLVAPCKKKYTLVLDLDETLIHLRQKKDIINIKNDINIKINNTSDYFYDNYDKNNNKYLLQFRVGLFSFLTILKPFYEIISFTSATREYADVIINEIEKNRKFFDHKFYREHTIIYKDTFVKDISRIGRDIKKIIIVDNNERNFILNKENGIKIAPYYGDEENNNVINNSINSENNGRLSYRGKKGNDNILLELKKILVMIYKDNYDDLREALKDYEDLIKTKVSMNF